MTAETDIHYMPRNPKGPPEPLPYVEVISCAIRLKEYTFRKLEARLDRGEITLDEFKKDVMVLREI